MGGELGRKVGRVGVRIGKGECRALRRQRSHFVHNLCSSLGWGKVRVDFVRPKEGEFDERECATVLIGNANKYANSPLLLTVAR